MFKFDPTISNSTYQIFGAPTPLGPFSGTFQFDATGAVDAIPNPDLSQYVLNGTITGFGGTSAALLVLTADVGGGHDTLFLIDDTHGFRFQLSLPNIPVATYIPGDFVPAVPLNLSGLTGATFQRDQLPPLPVAPNTIGQQRIGTVENLTLAVVPEPATLSLLALGGMAGVLRRWRSSGPGTKYPPTRA